MTLREKINKIPPLYAGVVAGAMVVLLVVVVVWAIRSPGDPTAAQQVVLKCLECGHVERMSLEQVNKGTTIVKGYRGAPGVKCPKCAKRALGKAYECPNGHGVFSAYAPKASTERDEVGTAIKCPKCDWDPVAEEQKQMAELAKRGKQGG